MIRKKADSYVFTYTLISEYGVKCKMHSNIVRKVGDTLYLDGVQHTVTQKEIKYKR